MHPLLRFPAPQQPQVSEGASVAFRSALQPPPAATTASSTAEQLVYLPLPIKLPPQRYGKLDLPWAVDVQHSGVDVNNKRIQDAGQAGLPQDLVPGYYEDYN